MQHTAKISEVDPDPFSSDKGIEDRAIYSWVGIRALSSTQRAFEL